MTGTGVGKDASCACVTNWNTGWPAAVYAGLCVGAVLCSVLALSGAAAGCLYTPKLPNQLPNTFMNNTPNHPDRLSCALLRLSRFTAASALPPLPTPAPG